MTDPFKARPKPSAQQAAPSTPPAPSGDSEPAKPPLPSRGRLEDMNKAALQALARDRGVSDEGTRADIVDRLTGSP